MDLNRTNPPLGGDTRPVGTASGLYLNGTSNTANGFNGNGTSAPFASRNGGSGDELSLKDLIELLSQALLVIRSKWYWGVLGALVIGGSLGALLLRRPVEHTAQTVVLAQSALDKIIGTQTDHAGDVQNRENSLRNHLSVMNSRKFRVRLAASLSPEERTKVAAPYLLPGAPADEAFLEGLLSSKMNVDRERGREFYTISVTHRDPDVALLLADRFTAEYLGLVQSEFREASKAGFDLLQKQSESLRQQIANIEEERLEFRKKNRIISRVDNQGILSARLQRLDSNLTDVRVRALQLGNQLQQAREDRQAADYPWNNAYLATYANNPVLRQELDRLNAQRSVLASRYGPKHPKLRDIDASIGGIRESIRRNFDLAVLDLDAQLQAAIETREQLQKEFNDAFAESIEIEKLASRYEIIGTDVESLRLTLGEVEKKLGEASLSSQLPTGFMQVVDPAFIVKPRLPKKAIYLGLMVVFAAGAFVLTPLLVNLLDERVKATTDLEHVLGKPLLGAVPYLRMRKEDRAHVVRNRVDIGASESFVGVGAQLDLMAPDSYPKTLLITSTLPGEGKSTIASNLAAAYTQLGKKVVLVDLDLRRPAQHTLQGVDGKTGFLSWARSGFPSENLLKPNGPLGLRVLPDGTHFIAAGGDEAQPSHYLISRELNQLLQQLKSTYDIVVIDTPPAGVFQDAAVLSRLAQQRILVARQAKAPVAQVVKVISDFDKSGSPFSGTVVNGFNPSAAHRKLAYGYHKNSYGYHQGQKKKKKATTS